MSDEKVYDKEAQVFSNDSDSEPRVGEVHHITQIDDLVEVPGVWAKVTAWSKAAHAETIGIQRLPESARDPKLKPNSNFFIWTTGNLHYAAVTTGALGPTIWGLGWWDSFLCVIFFNFLGCVMSGLIATTGPQTGMRTMVVARYSFGYWPSKIIAFFTAVMDLGWVTINTIAGSGLLYDAWDNKVPLVVCIIILMVLSILFVFFGFHFIEKFDRWGWIYNLTLFVIVVGVGGQHFTYMPMATGITARNGCLSYGALIWSWGIGWAPLTADYSSYLPEKTSKNQVFWWTWGGIYFSSTIAFLIGLALSSLTFNTSPTYNFPTVYLDGGYGALVGAIFLGHGTGLRNFGRFIQTLLGIGMVLANVPNMYSFGLDVQAISSVTQKVPRALVTILGGLAAMAISLGLRDDFIGALENFTDLFGYWCTPFATVLLLEHFLFRKRLTRYDCEVWDTPSKLPVGIAGIVAWLCGLTLALLSADQTWLIGPIASSFGGYGADLGFETSGATAAIVYIPLRFLELRIFKR